MNISQLCNRRSTAQSDHLIYREIIWTFNLFWSSVHTHIPFFYTSLALFIPCFIHAHAREYVYTHTQWFVHTHSDSHTHTHTQWFSTWGNTHHPQIHFAISGDDIFGCHNWGRVGAVHLSSSRDRNAASHPVVHRTVPISYEKKWSVQDVNSVKIEKLYIETVCIVLYIHIMYYVIWHIIGYTLQNIPILSPFPNNPSFLMTLYIYNYFLLVFFENFVLYSIFTQILHKNFLNYIFLYLLHY